jgi:excinuclease ABC subunit A
MTLKVWSGYKAGRFSFNVKGGRCETLWRIWCSNNWNELLPDVYVECETAKENVLIEKHWNWYKGKSISDVLNMTVDGSVPFEMIPKIL